LACAAATPVARLGLEFVQATSITSAGARAEIARLANTRCTVLGREAALWALGHVGAADHYDREAVTRFFDSLSAEVRDGAWTWLGEKGSVGASDAALFARLLETPYDDLRLRLIDELNRKAALPGVSAGDLLPVWSSVLLSVHRGGRQKLKATAQIADALVARPERVHDLLPVLVAAVRSIRGPEQRAALAAVMRVVDQRPELTLEIEGKLPELAFQPR
jgi:hypothetical protein